jgi:two-component system chemotaxis response regulator CheB
VSASSVEELGGTPVPVVAVALVAGTQTRLRQLSGLVRSEAFSVVGGACDSESAEELVRETRPDAVLVDLDLFGGGLDAIERIMAGRPTPIVVCGAAAEHPEAAIAAGAVDVVGALDVGAGTPAYSILLQRHLRVASRVPVITHPRARLRQRGLADRRSMRGPRVVAIGASTGGPPALATILRELPAEFPAAVIVVQHMAEGFVEGLARWLDGVCPLRVVVAADGERLVEGTVYLAPAGLNLLVRRGHRVALVEPPQGQFHVPGVDATFGSVAEECGRSSIGVLLTGMGRDGAAGLRALRDVGAHTIGQDEATSVVYGMPGAARQLDAVEAELPLGDIGRAIVASAGRSAPRTEATP